MPKVTRFPSFALGPPSRFLTFGDSFHLFACLTHHRASVADDLGAFERLDGGSHQSEA
ncbi:hypothetical protein ACFQ6N_26000 [Kitasatospora sp. NPDC056446]|uniref:hypothetical protein n=1 Tax=Kitasatospora sp. NPDC056446 TaxID=3345819 RepID=UPI0036C3D2BF